MIVPSIRQLAPLLGISHTMLNRQFGRGKFSAEPGGGFDVDKVKASLAATKDLDQPSQAKGAGREPGEGKSDEDSGSHRAYNRAKAFKEQVRARQAELDLKERTGELVNAAEAKAQWGEMISSARSAILLLPSKLAPKVASVDDVRECQQIIERDVRQLLTELAEYQPEHAE